ncbi:MAG: hypothetical protein JST04_08740 [Bdellovibrionales bacterium]|nr:hypothetical protein [Bdellovibrionales bacterium]
MVKILAGLALLTLFSGCGSDDRPAGPFLEAQKNLPDDGYWFCRLDYTVHYRNGAADQEFFTALGEGRSAVKQKIAQQCINSSYEVDCSVAVTNQFFNCTRAENTGHMTDYRGVTYCRLPYTTQWRDGSIEHRMFESTGKDQKEAVKKIYSSCTRGLLFAYTRECTDAILADAMDCKPVQ